MRNSSVLHFTGADGNDAVSSEGGDDALTGSGGDDYLESGNGKDTLRGGAGMDTLLGEGGGDVIRSGAGTDIFRYEDVTDSTPGAADVIVDFSTGKDTIELDRIDANPASSDDDAFDFIGSGPFSNTPGELRIVQGTIRSGFTTVSADVDGDGTADLLIRLANRPSVTEDDLSCSLARWLNLDLPYSRLFMTAPARSFAWAAIGLHRVRTGGNAGWLTFHLLTFAGALLVLRKDTLLVCLREGA